MMNQTTEKLLKAGTLVCMVLAFYILILAVNGVKENRYIGGGVPAGNVISVSGTGEVFATPDIAEISFDVVVEKDTIAAAQEEAATKINAVLAFLEDSDIAERDIKTTNYSANPRYEWRNEATVGPGYGGGTAGVSYPYYDGGDTRVLVGYEVRQSVTVKIRDTEKVGSIVAGIGELGVTDMYGPNFTIDDEDELLREARKEAIRDAETKAKELAKDLDVKLVRVVSFSESGGPYPYYRGLEMAAMDSAGGGKTTPEIPAGENKLTSYVTITYEIR